MDDSVAAFVAQARRAAFGGDERAVVRSVAPLLQTLAASRSWMRPEHLQGDAEQGFGIHVLHEEPDHGLWLVAVTWLPHRGAAPHNHGTWAVIAGVDGEEENVGWTRREGKLRRGSARLVGPGQVAMFLSEDLHSVANPGERPTLSLHVYGRNLNYVERSQFDPETGAERPFTLQLHQGEDR